MNKFLKVIYNHIISYDYNLGKYTINQIDQAIKKLYDFYDFPDKYDIVLNDLENGYLRLIYFTKSNILILWYDDEIIDRGIYVDTLEIINKD